MSDHQELRAELKNDRDKLAGKLADLGIDVDGGSKDFADDEGFADSGSVTAEKGELMTLARSLRENLDGIEAALARLDDGSYGLCVKCGARIPEVRLEIVPAAPHCLECADAQTV